MFQIKDFRSIVASMVNVAKASQSQVTDFSVGSVARTLLESPAIEIEELYLQMLLGLKESMETAIYSSFGFEKLQPVGASGLVRFTAAVGATLPLTIPAGTIVAASDANGNRYQTSLPATLPANLGYVDVMVYSIGTGSATNAAANTVSMLVTSVAGVGSVTNQSAFTNGTDLETSEEQRSRFGDYISTISRGTAASMRYGALQVALYSASGAVTESVKFCATEEKYLTDSNFSVGEVYVYIHNGVDGASTSLVNRTREVVIGYYDTDGKPIAGWKPAGIRLQLSAATTQSVNVTGSLTVLAGYDEANAIAQATALVREYIDDLDIAQDVYVSKIIAAMMGVEGVANVALTSPAADVSIAVNAKAMTGTVTLT